MINLEGVYTVLPTPFDKYGDFDSESLRRVIDLYLLEELISGANGAMTGFAYPKLLVETVSKWNAGRHDEAADFFYRHVPLMRFEFQPGIGMAIRKEILKRRGALSHAGIRAPGAELDEPTKASLDRVLKWLDL